MIAGISSYREKSLPISRRGLSSIAIVIAQLKIQLTPLHFLNCDSKIMKGFGIISALLTLAIILVLIYLGIVLALPSLKDGNYIGIAVVIFLIWCIWGFIKKF